MLGFLFFSVFPEAVPYWWERTDMVACKSLALEACLIYKNKKHGSLKQLHLLHHSYLTTAKMCIQFPKYKWNQKQNIEIETWKECFMFSILEQINKLTVINIISKTQHFIYWTMHNKLQFLFWHICTMMLSCVMG